LLEGGLDVGSSSRWQHPLDSWQGGYLLYLSIDCRPSMGGGFWALPKDRAVVFRGSPAGTNRNCKVESGTAGAAGGIIVDMK
jgi:hypothetical protein